MSAADLASNAAVRQYATTSAVHLPLNAGFGNAVRPPTRITGTIVSFDGGWIVINGTEHRWNADGSLSAQVTAGTFTLERSVVTYFAEVA